MTEAAGGGGRAEMECRIIEKSMKDASFRQRLLADPGAALERELGMLLPDGVEVRTLEETAKTIYLVLPPGGSGDVQTHELSDLELETVAGGWSPGETSSDCSDPRCTVSCAL
jgi:hypothetical protein